MCWKFGLLCNFHCHCQPRNVQNYNAKTTDGAVKHMLFYNLAQSHTRTLTVTVTVTQTPSLIVYLKWVKFYPLYISFFTSNFTFILKYWDQFNMTLKLNPVVYLLCVCVNRMRLWQTLDTSCLVLVLLYTINLVSLVKIVHRLPCSSLLI